MVKNKIKPCQRSLCQRRAFILRRDALILNDGNMLMGGWCLGFFQSPPAACGQPDRDLMETGMSTNGHLGYCIQCGKAGPGGPVWTKCKTHKLGSERAREAKAPWRTAPVSSLLVSRHPSCWLAAPPGFSGEMQRGETLEEKSFVGQRLPPWAT